MGFFKTLLTRNRDDELDETEKQKFEEFSQTTSEESEELEEVKKRSLNIQDILNFIQYNANDSDLIKIKNIIATKEDADLQFNENIYEEAGVDIEDLEDEVNLDNLQDELDLEVIPKSGNNESKDNKTNENLEEDFIDFNDEEEDLDITSLAKTDEKRSDDPTLFSVVHDELMELFKEGQIVLLKEEFEFPTIGKKDTLAFGIFNSEIDDIKDQTHWFVQRLKQFSRLKECKMLLSEENEKDLILEVGDNHAILLCFKANNLISTEFEFNRKWE